MMVAFNSDFCFTLVPFGDRGLDYNTVFPF